MLESPIQFLKGVGPKRAELFEGLGIRSVGDLLYYFPRAWQDRRPTADLTLPTADGLVVARVKVVKARQIPAGATLSIFKADVSTGEAALKAVWFKHVSRRFDVFSQLKKDAAPGADLWLVGRREADLAGLAEIHVDEHYRVEDERAGLHVGGLTPIYPLTEGIHQRFLRELVHTALPAAKEAPEVVPPSLREKRGLLAASQALHGVHFPGSAAELEAARGRLAYEEFLLLELAWSLKRRQTQGIKKGFHYDIRRHLLTPFKQKLAFQLTNAQRRVIKEIFEDLQKPYPMTRLLQGDVGSGKTVVAVSAMLLAVENGYQSALMAPTEILAEQHYRTISEMLEGLPVRIVLLTSSVPKKERQKRIEALKNGLAEIAIGTHALLEADVAFRCLSLLVLDEQHRFGVRQRATMRAKGSSVDLLVMTATPIPRTLALSLYGDLDASVIDELPPGKARAETIVAAESGAFARVREQAAQGRQAYIVYPVIEDSKTADLQSAKAEFDRLSKTIFHDLRVGLVHGAMPSKKKAEVMKAFAARELDVLVATQVIEVGIDVPNATVMVIENADRFGLASLHQLRGRIGRGRAASFCYLVAGPKHGEQAAARLATLAATHDGFRIGEEDLKLRGPGEFLGTAQHGELALKIADLFKDAGLLSQAREDAEELLAKDVKLVGPDVAPLRRRLISLYQRQWNWIDLS